MKTETTDIAPSHTGYIPTDEAVRRILKNDEFMQIFVRKLEIEAPGEEIGFVTACLEEAVMDYKKNCNRRRAEWYERKAKEIRGFL